MRVTVNGLLPLITSSTLEFSNGDEVQADLVYEKLERHCSSCLMLDHDVKDCPEMVKAPMRSDKQAHPYSEDAVRLPGNIKERLSTRQIPAYQKKSGNSRRYEPTVPSGQRRRDDTPHSQSERQNYQTEAARYSHNPTRSPQPEHHRETKDQSYKRKERSPQKPIWVEKRRRELPRALLSSPERSETPRERRPPLERVPSPAKQVPETPPPLALQVAIGEVREVMTRYSNCPDPCESAVRKDRARLAEEQGEYEETAAHMVRAAIEYEERERLLNLRMEEDLVQLEVANQAAKVPFDRQQFDRIPIRQRLGPLNATHGLSPPAINTTSPPPVKRKPGRPPGKNPVPKALMGMGQKIRRVVGVKPSPRRNLNQPSKKVGKTKEAQKKQAKAGPSGVKRRLIPQSSEVPDEELSQLPRNQRNADFQNPSSPVP
ncbi:hypothetical protein AALP_AA8G411000 [Arabis alpina]|nr:hypothetical protein AALP_AA8G411000 [Arabis alpina]